MTGFEDMIETADAVSGPPRPKLKRLGRTELVVSEIGCGCSSLGGVLDRRGEAEGLRTLQMAMDRGINFFDTSDAYSLGRSEELLGQAVRERRDRVFIATKGGSVSGAFLKGAAKSRYILAPVRKAIRPFKRQVNRLRHSSKQYDYSLSYLRTCVEASLRRLGTDYIDLYQLHNPTREVLEAGDFIDTLETLKAEGKIRHYGIACYRLEDALLCARYDGVSTVQIPMSLADQEGVASTLSDLASSGIGIMAREALAQGLLTDSPGSSLAEQKAWSWRRIQARGKRAESYRFLARPGRSIAQAALQFVLQMEEVHLVLVGMISRAELEENLGALTAPPLSAEELGRISRLAGAA